MGKSADEILYNLREKFNFPVSTNEGTLTHAIFSSFAFTLAEEYANRDHEISAALIETGFDKYLDTRAKEFGYKRKLGTHAVGECTFIGRAGTYINDGLIITSNGIDFIVVEPGTIIEGEADSRVTLVVEAVEVGESGNIEAGSFFSTNEEMEFTNIFNSEPFKGGTNIETDEDFRDRFLYGRNNIATSGNVEHYKQWAMEVDGVSDADVTPLWNGNGTVKINILDKNKENVSEEVIKNTKEHIEQIRPIGADVTISTPSIISLAIKAKVVSGKSDEIAIKNEFANEADIYLRSLNSNVIYSKLFAIIASADGVIDVLDFTVNGLKENISLSSDQIANIGAIDIEIIGGE